MRASGATNSTANSGLFDSWNVDEILVNDMLYHVVMTCCSIIYKLSVHNGVAHS